MSTEMGRELRFTRKRLALNESHNDLLARISGEKGGGRIGEEAKIGEVLLVTPAAKHTI